MPLSFFLYSHFKPMPLSFFFTVSLTRLKGISLNYVNNRIRIVCFIKPRVKYFFLYPVFKSTKKLNVFKEFFLLYFNNFLLSKINSIENVVYLSKKQLIYTKIKLTKPLEKGVHKNLVFRFRISKNIVLI